MPTVVDDRVKQYTTTSGTGSISFSGTIEGYKAFSDVLTSGDQTFYCILDGANGETGWEVGIGTFDGSLLSRDTVLSSSTGSKISLSGNISTIFITYAATNSIFTDGNNRLGIGTGSPSYALDVFGHDAWIQATGVIVGASGIVIGNHGISPGINALSDARVLGTSTATYLLDINIGNSGIYLGNQTQTKITSGGKSIHIGEQAGSGTTTGFSNVAIGYQAGKNITTGKRNVAIGAESYPYGDDNHDNVFIGFQSADSSSVGNYSIGIGAYAGYSEQGSNVNVGYKAGNSLWTYPINTTAIGYQSLSRAHIVTPHGANTMQYSVAVGSEAGYESYGAYGSTYLGAMAGYQGPGVGSVCIGFQAGRGISNIGIHDHLFIANSEPASNGTLIKGLFNTKEVAIGKTDINVSGVGTLQVYPKQATSKGIVVVSAASQSAALMEWKDSASATIATMTPSGVLNAYGFVASGDIAVDGKMIFNDADGSAWINLKSPDSISSTYTLNLPSGIGVAGQSLHTNADGYTYWAVPAGGGTMSSFVISDGSTTQTVVDGNTVTFSPVSNRTTTTVSATDTLTIGLADDITVNRVAASGLGVMSASGIDVTSSGVWFHDLDRSTMITMRAHDTVSASYNFYLPSGVGTSTQVLKTDGAGTSYWDASDINSLTDVSFGGTNLTRTLIIGNAGPGATPVTGSLAADCEDNLAIGYLALNSITQGDGNLALGYNNLTGLTTGYTNVALGHNVAGAGAVTGYDNVAIGQSSMHSLTGGIRNIALGFSSLYGSTNGEYNISLGAMSQFYANDGDHNIAIGYASLYGNVDGSTTTGNNYNIGLGFETLKDITTGDRNIGIGYRAGLNLTSDSYMLYIASDAPASNGSLIKGDMTNKYLAVGKADVTLSTDPATFQVYVNAATDKGVVIQGAASQSDDLSSWKTSAGSIVAGMTPSGVLNTHGIVASGTGLRMHRVTPVVTSDTLYNVGGALYFNGSALAGGVSVADLNYVSGVAVYASGESGGGGVTAGELAGVSGMVVYSSGQAIANESDIVAVSGIANYASGQTIANESDIVAVSGIANYASGQTIANESDIVAVSGISNYASGQVIASESDIVAVSGISNYASGQTIANESDIVAVSGISNYASGQAIANESDIVATSGIANYASGQAIANESDIVAVSGISNYASGQAIENESLITYASGNTANIAFGSNAEGDILYHNGTSFTRLAKGTDNYILKMNGNAPNWEAESSGGGVSTADLNYVSGVAVYSSGQAIANESDIVASSGVAAYASGQAIANESDIVATSGIANYASGQAIANESDIVATSGIANYASGQAIANENDIVAVSGISNYASGQAIENEGLITYASGNTANITFGSNVEGDILYHNGTSFTRLAKGTDNHVLTMDGNVPNWEAAAAGSASAEATYASGQAIANESDIVATSGIAAYASGTRIAAGLDGSGLWGGYNRTNTLLINRPPGEPPYYGTGNDCSDNVGIGYHALRYIAYSVDNIALGKLSSGRLSSGDRNVSIGLEALYNNQTGHDNVAIGNNALKTANGGSNNIGIGEEAGYASNSSNMLFIAKGTEAANGTIIKGDMANKYLAIGKADVTLSTDPATLQVYPNAATDKVLLIRGYAAQSDDLTSWQTSAGAAVAAMTPSGVLNTYGIVASGVGVRLHQVTPTVTTDTLYNVGGSLYFDGSAVGGGSASAEATYASGQAIANESDIVAVSGISNYASGQVIANESDIVATSGIANYASGQAIANEDDIVAVSGIANYASGQANGKMTDFIISDGSTTQTIADGNTITFAATSNETTVAVSATDTVTIGLPNDVTIGSDLTVTDSLVVDTKTLVANASSYADRVGIGTAAPGYTLDVFGHDAWVQASGVRVGASGIILGGTAVTSTAAELNYLDITTLGTAAASKAMTWAADSTWTAAGGTCANLGTVTTVDINGGTIDGATIATSNVTVGSSKTLDVSGGTLTLAANQISGDKVEGGTIAATTITTLTTAGITATANIDIGGYDLRAATVTPDGLTSGRVVFAGTAGVLSDDADLTFSGDTLTATKIKVSDGGTIGSASDADVITIATEGDVTFSKATKPALKANSDGATVTFDLNEANVHTVTLGGNRTFAISNETAGQKFIIRILQDGTGSRLVSTWFSTIKWAGGSAPTLTTTAGKADVVGFIVTGTDTYDGFVVGQNI